MASPSSSRLAFAEAASRDISSHPSSPRTKSSEKPPRCNTASSEGTGSTGSVRH